MRVLLTLLTLMFWALVYYALNHESVSGVTLAHEAASVYCNIVELEKSEAASEYTIKELQDLKLEHTGFMQRGYELNQSERVDFLKTYSLMVSHCN